MTALYSILAAGELMKALPYIMIALAAVVLLIAFFVGFGKGWRHVSWIGLLWLAAAGGFFLVKKLLGAKILGVLTPALTGMGLQEKEVAFGAFFLTAFACILAALLVHGLCSLLFRPRVKWVRKQNKGYMRGDNGVLYDDEIEDYDDFEDYGSKDEYVRVGYKQPSVVGRLFGALFCIINVVTIAGIIGSVLLFWVSTTPLKDGALNVIYSHGIVQKLMNYTARYGIDALLIGILVTFAYGGRTKGFMESLRGLFIGLGVFLASAFAFYVPFSPWAQEGGVYLLKAFVERCTGAVSAMGLQGTFGAIAGKLFAGLILAAFIVVGMLLVNLLLKLLVKGIQSVGFLSAIDTALSCLVYLLIGLAVCLLVWAVLYILGTQGIFNVNEMFGANSTLSKGIFDVCDIRLKPILQDIAGKISGLFKR